ncbi:hypothetical protein TNCV_4972791 [Trichonephila clavipes]|nr:hypothetical protein TNCV_4972791 [Trichonephila clavipes]
MRLVENIEKYPVGTSIVFNEDNPVRRNSTSNKPPLPVVNRANRIEPGLLRQGSIRLSSPANFSGRTERGFRINPKED